MEHHQQGNKAALEVVRANETERQTRYPFTSGAIFSLLYLKDHLSREPALTYMTHKNVLILVSFLFLRFISSPHCHESLSSPCMCSALLWPLCSVMCLSLCFSGFCAHSYPGPLPDSRFFVPDLLVLTHTFLSI